MISTIRPAEGDDLRRLTPFCKLTIFWVVIALSEYFIVAAAICRFSVTQNVELEASDNILQISHSLGRNRVSGRFHLKRSKMSF